MKLTVLIKNNKLSVISFLAAVAQLVRAPGCGSGGRWFKSSQLYHFKHFDLFQFCLILEEKEQSYIKLSS